MDSPIPTPFAAFLTGFGINSRGPSRTFARAFAIIHAGEVGYTKEGASFSISEAPSSPYSSVRSQIILAISFSARH